METTGTIFEVKRFAVHDGPGVRTTIFLKGCPLRCLWCHNPESISPQFQLGCYEHKCINCGECADACPERAHEMREGKHFFDRVKCSACGKCEESCLGNALKLYGQKITVDEAVKLVEEDRDFYGEEGGVTLSGGEPLLQAEFCFELLKAVKGNGISTAVDTCGCVSCDVIEKVLPVTDIFLFDFKHSDSVMHKKLTGQDNSLILENLRRLSEAGARIEVRIPLIPACNDDEENILATGKILADLEIEKIKVLPFHGMAKAKYPALGMVNPMPGKDNLNNEAVGRAEELLRSCGCNILAPSQ